MVSPWSSMVIKDITDVWPGKSSHPLPIPGLAWSSMRPQMMSGLAGALSDQHCWCHWCHEDFEMIDIDKAQ